MKRIENNKARIFHRGNLFKRIKDFIFPFRGLRGAERFFSRDLRNLLKGLKVFSTNYPLLTTNYFKRIPLWGIMGAFLLSCTAEERYIGEGTGPEDKNPNEVTLTFSVRVPGQSTPVSTRAMDENAENYIESIDVLLFEVNSSGDEEYLYRAQGKNVQDGNTASEKSFDVTLTKQAGTRYRLVVLANASSALNALEPIAAGAEKELLLERLVYQNSSEWNASGSSAGSFDPIPMWGESSITPITDNMQIRDLKFLRMVARIDVGLNKTVTNFKLKEVYLYNRQTAGHMVPHMADTTWTDASTLKVERAHVPTSSSAVLSPQQAHLATGDTACIREIYLMESKAGTSASDATCIVVGGEYGTDGTTTYYRLDFWESDKVTYKDILRNHLYRVNINSVSGSGQGSPDDAFNSVAVNMEASILEWDEGDLPLVDMDGGFILSVSQGEFTLAKEATTTSDRHNILTIYTNYDVTTNPGWKIEKIVDSQGTDISTTWLDVDSWSGLPDVKTSISLLLQENTTGTDRTGYIYITAGRLSYIVTVTQTTQSGLSLFLYEGDGSTRKEITELVFSSRAAEINPQQFTIEWLPKTESPQISVSRIGDLLFDFDTPSDDLTDNTEINIVSYPNGNRTYTILPPAMTPAEIDPEQGGNPFLDKFSRVDFTVSNGTSYQTKSLFLRQLNYGMTYETAGKYLMDGNIHSFIVKSNAEWTATVTSDPNNVIQLLTSSGGNNRTGEEVRFRTVDDLTNPSIFQSPVKITFTSPLFDPVEVEIICASAEYVNPSNCYILEPGGTGILIPVSRANEYTTQESLATAIGGSTVFTAELLWTDNPNGVADNSNISRIVPIGTGDSSHILVLPGTAAGNAVVTVKVTDEIKWSWHIWVLQDEIISDHSLNGHDFMDRNLGAITKTPALETSLGLLYQWGRKDPFPGGYDFSVNDLCPIYTADGTPTHMTTVNMLSVIGGFNQNILINSIQDPSTFFYTSSSSVKDWYTYLYNYLNNDLWGHESTKSIYDPCPEGWRVPFAISSIHPWNVPNNDFKYSSSIKGVLYNNVAYYPAAGHIAFNSGTYSGTGSDGLYWTASGVPNTSGVAYSLQFSYQILYAQSNARAAGQSVRCVKE